jgi:formylglycine-generating enzyme required for sulfatase activity
MGYPSHLIALAVAVSSSCSGSNGVPARAHSKTADEPEGTEEGVGHRAEALAPGIDEVGVGDRRALEREANGGAADSSAELADGRPIRPCGSVPPDMACIAGGPFVRGSEDGPENARPAAQVHLQTFYMDVFEVTFAQYKACEKAGKCPRSGPRYTDFDHPNMPVQGVSWFEARTYCQAQGKSLPTEAQWEKAARGPDGALYSWGDEPVSCERAIIRDAAGRSCGRPKAKSKPEVGRPWDVGSRPAGAYGLHDMIGNSWEWVADWYTRSYEACGEPCAGVDPKGPCGGDDDCPGYGLKIVRGGSWYWDATRATGVYRRAHVPSNRPFHHFGFRCAASSEQAERITAESEDRRKQAPR